jgi:DNA-directed RNA polymerase specialized sigma24 family protein
LQASGFEEFVAVVEPRLRRALIATYGPERGREATAEALCWAFEHRDRLSRIRNPGAYLYRVGQSRSRLRMRRTLFERPTSEEPWVEPKLLAALAELPVNQRVAVVLVHAHGWSSTEAAEWLGLRPATVQKQVERGLARLRQSLEGVDHEHDRN